MMTEEIFKELPFAVTACNNDGIIVYMNEKSRSTFSKNETETLIGKSLYDCHPKPATLKIKELLKTGKTNVYTIEKKGLKKMIYQCPWYKNGLIQGLVEIALILPEEIPHFVRG